MAHRSNQFSRRLWRLAPAAGLALTLAACGSASDVLSTDGWFSKPISLGGSGNWNSTARFQVSNNRPLGPEDFVDAEGRCPPSTEPEAMAAASPPPPAAPPPGTSGLGGAESAPPPPPPAAGGVALEMSECQVVRRIGHPDRVEMATNDRGERAVALTYVNGSRPGIYRFVSGRLTVVEKGPDPAPQRPARRNQPRRT